MEKTKGYKKLAYYVNVYYNKKTMNVTIKDIAEKAGISYATVSRALNDKYGVNPKTKSLILEIAAALNYSPNAIARGLVKRQTHTLGLIIPDITNPFFPEVARGVEDYSEKMGYSIFLCNSNWDKAKERKYVDLLVEKRVDGLIIAPSSSKVSSEDKAVFSRLPVILMSGAMPDSGAASIVVDDVKGGLMAGQYLIGLGRKKLCFIGGAEDSFSVKERFKGFSMAAESAGSGLLSGAMVRFGDYRQKSGFRLMKELLSGPESSRPDAVFASNDLLAIGVVQAVLEAGLRVPEDIAVIGFDNIPAASFQGVELTTVGHPKYRMGELAAEMLLSVIASPGEIKKQRVVLEPELVIRKTA